MKIFRIISMICLSGLVFSCQETENVVDENLGSLESEEIVFKGKKYEPLNLKTYSPNAKTQDSPYEIELYSVEYITQKGSDQVGQTIIFSDRGSKKLSTDFSPVAKLAINGTTDISYYVDQIYPGLDLDLATKEAAIDRAASTWANVSCSDLGLFKVPAVNVPIGVIGAFEGYNYIPGYIADVNHAGWLPPAFFDEITPNGGQFILGATFTLILTSNGQPIDTNGDGKIDVAFREIYYNDNFIWGDNDEDVAGFAAVDVESIALHEMGHGLSQAHFGKAFLSKKGEYVFSPQAVMNAGYFGGYQADLKATDEAGHCSIWSNWSNK